MSASDLLVLSITLFCVVRGIVDIRERRYAWGAVGLLLALIMVLQPLVTISVKLDLPPSAADR